MAGPTGAGYTHFNKVSGINGVFKGAAGSEVRIDTGTLTTTVALAGGSTAAEATYVAFPFDAKLVGGYVICNAGTVGTGATTLLQLTDTAGATYGTASLTATGTLGAEVAAFSSVVTTTISAGTGICIAKASCATAYGVAVTICATRMSSTA
jgi:hypothetical protein